MILSPHRLTPFVACGFFLALALNSWGGIDVYWSSNAHVGHVHSVAFSSNGLLATAGADRKVKLWRASDGALVNLLTNHAWEVNVAAFSPDASLLATCSTYGLTEDDAVIKLWRVSDGQELRTIRLQAPAIAFSPDGTLLAAAVGTVWGNIAFLRLSDGALVKETPFAVHSYGSLGFSPDGRFLAADASNAGGVWIYKVSDASEVRQINPSGAMVAYGPDGKSLAIPYSDSYLGEVVGIADPDTATFDRPFEGHRSRIISVVFSGDGKRLVSASRAVPPHQSENAIRVWRVPNRKPIAVYDLRATLVTSLAASPDNRFFAYGTQDGTLVVARMPVHVTNVKRHGGDAIVEWEGTGGLYQLQQSTNLAATVWHNVGEPTTANSTTNPATGGPVSYRVRELPTP